MKVLALVPARAGSKRVPGKNIRPLGGRPLIAWTVEAALGVPGVVDVLVSTDSAEAADIAAKAGADVPWLRPAELATDEATAVDVALHALDWYENNRGPVDGLLLLQPTSPFRRRETIERAIERFAQSGEQPVVGVSPAHSHPFWCVTLNGQHRITPFIDGDGFRRRSQDLPPAYVVNGAIYVLAPSTLRATRSFIPDNATGLVIDDERESLDIDTEWDWALAESVLRAGRA